MKPLRYFLDTHDRKAGTSPEKLTPEEFEVFFGQYQPGDVFFRRHPYFGHNAA